MRYVALIATLGVLTFSLGCGKTLFAVGSEDFGDFEISVNEAAQPEVSATFNTLGFVNWVTCQDWMSWANSCAEKEETNE